MDPLSDFFTSPMWEYLMSPPANTDDEALAAVAMFMLVEEEEKEMQEASAKRVRKVREPDKPRSSWTSQYYNDFVGEGSQLYAVPDSDNGNKFRREFRMPYLTFRSLGLLLPSRFTIWFPMTLVGYQHYSQMCLLPTVTGGGTGMVCTVVTLNVTASVELVNNPCAWQTPCQLGFDHENEMLSLNNWVDTSRIVAALCFGGVALTSFVIQVYSVIFTSNIHKGSLSWLMILIICDPIRICVGGVMGSLLCMLVAAVTKEIMWVFWNWIYVVVGGLFAIMLVTALAEGLKVLMCEKDQNAVPVDDNDEYDGVWITLIHYPRFEDRDCELRLVGVFDCEIAATVAGMVAELWFNMAGIGMSEHPMTHEHIANMRHYALTTLCEKLSNDDEEKMRIFTENVNHIRDLCSKQTFDDEFDGRVCFRREILAGGKIRRRSNA